jgi:peptide/nickel transport system permease protein
LPPTDNRTGLRENALFALLFIINMIKILLYKLAQTVSLILGILILSFLLFNVVPGDPARIMLGINASEESVKNLRKQLGTDRPVYAQLLSHLNNIVRLDFGRSVIDGRNVRTEVLDKCGVTGRIGLVGAFIALGISYIVNLLVYRVPHTQILIKLSSLGAVMPTFFTGLIIALTLGYLFPSISLTSFNTSEAEWSSIFAPAFVISLYPSVLMITLLREKIVQAGHADYALAARAFGFPPSYIFHAVLLRSVSVSWLALWVNQLSTIFISSLIVEFIFTISGVGSLMANAIQQKDFPMLQGVIVINALFFILLSQLSNLIYPLLDPRIS